MNLIDGIQIHKTNPKDNLLTQQKIFKKVVLRLHNYPATLAHLAGNALKDGAGQGLGIGGEEVGQLRGVIQLVDHASPAHQRVQHDQH